MALRFAAPFSFWQFANSYDARVASQRPEQDVLDDLPLHWPEPELAESLPLALAFWSLNIARTARDRFAMLCAVGVGAFVFWHVIINIGMVTGTLPVVGLWLPLVSYGGTATVTVMAAMGLLTSISLRRHVF